MIYFLLYLFIEVVVSSSVAGEIGGLMMFLEIIVSFMVGIGVFKHYSKLFHYDLGSVMQKSMSLEDFKAKQVFRILGAILLIIPGVFTDTLGLLMQIEIFSVGLAKFLLRIDLKPKTTYYSHTHMNVNFKEKSDKKDEEIIDVEVIDDNRAIK